MISSIDQEIATKEIDKRGAVIWGVGASIHDVPVLDRDQLVDFMPQQGCKLSQSIQAVYSKPQAQESWVKSRGILKRTGKGLGRRVFFVIGHKWRICVGKGLVLKLSLQLVLPPLGIANVLHRSSRVAILPDMSVYS